MYLQESLFTNSFLGSIESSYFLTPFNMVSFLSLEGAAGREKPSEEERCMERREGQSGRQSVMEVSWSGERFKPLMDKWFRTFDFLRKLVR